MKTKRYDGEDGSEVSADDEAQMTAAEKFASPDAEEKKSFQLSQWRFHRRGTRPLSP